MILIYQFLSIVIGPLLPFYLKARLKKGKEDKLRYNEKLGKNYPATFTDKGNGVLWFFAASLGESKSVLPIINHLVSNGYKVVITTGTLTSAEFLKNNLPQGAIHVFSPLDKASIIKKFIKHFKPKALFLVEEELWPNLVLTCKSQGLKLVFLGAKFSLASSTKWLKYKKSFTYLLKQFDFIYTSAKYQGADVFDLCGVAYQKMDSLKYAQVEALTSNKSKKLDICCEDGFDIESKNSVVFISSHSSEEQIVAKAIKQISAKLPNFIALIAPRHIDTCSSLLQNLQSQGLNVVTLSSGQKVSSNHDVLIVDAMGLVPSCINTTGVSIVCGSFVDGIGGHNILEPAALVKPVITGEFNQNFDDIIDAMLESGAIIKSSSEAICGDVVKLFQNKSKYKEFATKANEFAMQKSQSHISLINKIINDIFNKQSN